MGSWPRAFGTRQGDLVLLGARVYDAALKRWLQADTVDPLRYTYADGDPANRVDPSGQMSHYLDGLYYGESPPGRLGRSTTLVHTGNPKEEPDCRDGPSGPECRLPEGQVPWRKSPEQEEEEAKRAHWGFMWSTSSVRADNARMAALGAE